MSARESEAEAASRWQRLALLQEAYPTFVPFLRDMMKELGFSTSDIQEDIANWIQYGPAILMVQAQRGEAKTTIAAIFAVWSLIHDPTFRVLVVSAGETQANEISTLIVKLINQVDILEMLRPDSSAGDRTSVEHFDVHYTLKGIDKSPSVACVGINSNLPGKRADLLIPDDVESPKNSLTATARAQLELFTQEFTSISVSEKKGGGRIVWLGTPQSIDSVYNGLPGRGVAMRIWPGRYPSPEMAKHYGGALAPIIQKRLAEGAEVTGYGLDGTLGAPVDPLLRSDTELLKQEIDKTSAGFQLQFMLLTAMSDALRHPLKVHRIITMDIPGLRVPMSVIPGFGASETFDVLGEVYKLSVPHSFSTETMLIPHTTLYIDPAGGGANADETAYAYGGLANSNIFVKAWGGLKGGHDEVDLKAVAELVIKHRPTLVKIEKNFGYGLYMTAVRPIITARVDEYNKKVMSGEMVGEYLPMPGFEEDYVSGQKEPRIIDTLEPVMGRGSIIFDNSIIRNEANSVSMHEQRFRKIYSGFFQLAKLTRDKGSLIHDDRADALSGLVAHYGPALVVDQKKAVSASQKREWERMQRNPLNKPASALPAPKATNSLQKRMRKL
jgi:hypothetical protein